MLFEFNSEGPQGVINKIVQYTETNAQGIYNLAFGDKDPNGDIDDTSISNNGDRDKILATVASTVYAFTNKYPESWVYATGSTKGRTRLYRMGIGKYLKEMENDFEIYGLRNQEWESFVSNAEYEAFLVKRKNL
ncbi:hypothetical protein BH09BAC1_BH09BAC1_04790 [soil metagenome]